MNMMSVRQVLCPWTITSLRNVKKAKSKSSYVLCFASYVILCNRITTSSVAFLNSFRTFFGRWKAFTTSFTNIQGSIILMFSLFLFSLGYAKQKLKWKCAVWDGLGSMFAYSLRLPMFFVGYLFVCFVSFLLLFWLGVFYFERGSHCVVQTYYVV